jgi:hypothetical protein
MVYVTRRLHSESLLPGILRWGEKVDPRSRMALSYQ